MYSHVNNSDALKKVGMEYSHGVYDKPNYGSVDFIQPYYITQMSYMSKTVGRFLTQIVN